VRIDEQFFQIQVHSGGWNLGNIKFIRTLVRVGSRRWVFNGFLLWQYRITLFDKIKKTFLFRNISLSKIRKKWWERLLLRYLPLQLGDKSHNSSTSKHSSTTAVSNPNRLEGQIYAKQSCRGPKYRHFLQI
jgi:hypothetical protein